jgi:hypothetical protein
VQAVGEHTFYIVYDGPALEASEMDVRQLAPALHAIGDLLEAANRVANGKAFKTQVKVKGSFKTGCFGIDFVYCQNLLESFVGLFTSDYITATLNLAGTVGLVGGGGYNLIKFIKWLRGRQIRRVIELDGGKVRIEVDDDHIELERAVIELFKDIEVRKALDAVVKVPLETDGIDSFGTGKDKDSVEFIRKEEAIYFAAPDLPDELISESTYETVVKVVNVAFQEENMWRLAEGQNIFYAKIEDQSFIHDVQANERAFAKDDLFFVTLRKKQFLGEKGNVKTDYAVVKVNDHRSAARQIPLFFEPPPKPSPS